MAFVRLNPDFTYDLTLDGGGPLPTDFGNVGFIYYSIALQPDGKIIAVVNLDVSSVVPVQPRAINLPSPASIATVQRIPPSTQRSDHQQLQYHDRQFLKLALYS